MVKPETESVKKYVAVTAIGVAVLCVSAYSLFQLSKSRTFQFFGDLTSRVGTDEKVVALTFDDAPTDKVGEVLNVLKEKNVLATFYEIGAAVERDPARAKAIVDAGMDVGNHSWSHERFYFKSQVFINSEIQRTNRVISASGYRGEITFRPPNGKKLFGLPWYLWKHNIRTVMWDVEPDTYAPAADTGRKTDFLVGYTLAHVRPGSIILLHPLCGSGCEADRMAIPRIIDGLREKGYRFLTVPQLLALESS